MTSRRLLGATPAGVVFRSVGRRWRGSAWAVRRSSPSTSGYGSGNPWGYAACDGGGRWRVYGPRVATAGDGPVEAVLDRRLAEGIEADGWALDAADSRALAVPVSDPDVSRPPA